MAPRVVVIGLASDYGCQVQLTNMGDQLLDALGLVDLSYWQLVSSGHMPTEYDVAIIEGAVTTEEHQALLRQVRSTASTVIAIGACAITGGIPGLANHGALEAHAQSVYAAEKDIVAAGRVSPGPIESVIEVDYHVPGCPIQPAEFLSVLQKALRGLANRVPREPLCAECKVTETVCFYEKGIVCLGLVSRAGCGAVCVVHGRPCTACRGINEDANLDTARDIAQKHSVAPAALDVALDLYNSTSGVR